jgi:hypothetical protein
MSAALSALNACGMMKVSTAAVEDMKITDPFPDASSAPSSTSIPRTAPMTSISKLLCQSCVAPMPDELAV